VCSERYILRVLLRAGKKEIQMVLFESSQDVFARSSGRLNGGLT
jgi:hypothetical protein